MLMSRDIPAGERAHFNMLDPGSVPCIMLRIINYHDMGFDWSGRNYEFRFCARFFLFSYLVFNFLFIFCCWIVFVCSYFISAHTES